MYAIGLYNGVIGLGGWLLTRDITCRDIAKGGGITLEEYFRTCNTIIHPTPQCTKPSYSKL
jgi:hypothetical protein